jgi:hypothetical protein
VIQGGETCSDWFAHTPEGDAEKKAIAGCTHAQEYLYQLHTQYLSGTPNGDILDFWKSEGALT